jgi:hypothetical protein
MGTDYAGFLIGTQDKFKKEKKRKTQKQDVGMTSY